jgi:hypothetical protein
VAAEYQEHFGEHAYDVEGNFIGGESSEGQDAWADMFDESAVGDGEATAEGTPTEEAPVEAAVVEEAPAEETPVEDAGAEEVATEVVAETAEAESETTEA